ncbi:ABC transporter permease [Rothia aerolata]|uniref:ABC transporter permease n=1 Tax=Rothia aerolata TaxID=1812262 RepID=A0A917IRR7_9MICC|nr:ABC transporter permease subunit [Rothia aerolata]GGH60671.1 ABC transporter permease [Rothia aerolata]
MTSSAHRSVPAAFTVPALLGVLVIAGPFLGLMVNIPWTEAWQLMTSPEALSSVKLSVATALIATVICGLLGLPLSLYLTKVIDRSRYRKLGLVLYALLYTPVILSPVVSGLALTFFWGRLGLVGSLLDGAGVVIPFTSTAVVVTQVFVGLPFFVATAVTSLRAVPAEFEHIALVEGATPWEVTSKVLLPVAAPGLATAFLLSFARALGEYGATVTFAGNIAEKTRTIPLNIELMLSSNLMPQALGSALQLMSLYLIVLGIGLFLVSLRRIRSRA